jgi:capsular exopolysaccharide synthesis family protein
MSSVDTGPNGQYETSKPLTIDAEENDFLSDFDVGKVVVVVKKNLLWVLLIFTACIAVAFAYLRYTKPIFESSATLQMEVKGIAPTLELGIFRNENSLNDYLIGESQFIRSNVVIDDVIKELQMYIAYYRKGRVLYEEKFFNCPFKVEDYEIKNKAFYNRQIFVEVIDTTRFILSYDFGGQNIVRPYRFGSVVDNEHFRCKISTNLTQYVKELPPGDYYFTIHDHAYLQGMISSNLKVFPSDIKARVIQISYQDPNSYKANSVVEYVGRSYLAKNIANRNKEKKQTIEFLEQQMDTLESLIERTYIDIQNYKLGKSGRGDSLPNWAARLRPTVEEIIANIKKFQEERIRLSSEDKLYGKIVDFIERDSSELLTASLAMGVSDARVGEMLRTLSARKQEMERVALSYREPSTVIRQRQLEMDKLTQELLKIISFDRYNLNERIIGLEQQIQAQERQLPSGSRAGSILDGLDLELQKRNRYLASYQATFEQLLARRVDMQVAEAGTVANFQFLSTASLPEEPVAPNRNQIYIYSLLSAAVMSAVLIVLRYLTLNKITSVREIEQATKAPILGLVPHYAKTKMDASQLVVNINPKASISEAFRSIRTNLDFLAPKASGRTISVTSTISGEGKTFVAVNLAGIISLSDSRVIVLDLDLRKPKVHLAFGAENINGVSNLLVGKASLEQCIQKSVLMNLDFISAGPHPPNPAELLMSEEFTKLVARLKETYDVIVFDTPPVGIVTDGMIVMKNTDLPIYVVRSDYSKRMFLTNVNRLITANNFRRMTIVLNGVGARGSYGYGYNYGYGYGYGYGSYGSSYGYNNYGYYDEPSEDEGLLAKIKKIFARK